MMLVQSLCQNPTVQQRVNTLYPCGDLQLLFCFVFVLSLVSLSPNQVTNMSLVSQLALSTDH